MNKRFLLSTCTIIEHHVGPGRWRWQRQGRQRQWAARPTTFMGPSDRQHRRRSYARRMLGSTRNLGQSSALVLLHAGASLAQAATRVAHQNDAKTLDLRCVLLRAKQVLESSTYSTSQSSVNNEPLLFILCRSSDGWCFQSRTPCRHATWSRSRIRTPRNQTRMTTRLTMRAVSRPRKWSSPWAICTPSRPDTWRVARVPARAEPADRQRVARDTRPTSYK